MVERNGAELADEDGGIAQIRKGENPGKKRGLAAAQKAGQHRERDRLRRHFRQVGKTTVTPLIGEREEPLPRDDPIAAILRLIDRNGRPSVKLSTSDQGGALALVSDTEDTYVQLSGRGLTATKDGRHQAIP